MVLNVDKDARMLPPTNVVYMRSVGAEIFILVSFGADGCRFTSLSKRSPNPGNKVDPPASTI